MSQLFAFRWPKYWSFSFSLSPSNEHPILISFRVDWLDLPAVQGTLKSLFQHHSSKTSIFWCSAFFIVQLLHPYMTTGKTIALTTWTFIDKVMSLLLNMLSRLVITFLPRSKCLLISWLQSPPTVMVTKHETRMRCDDTMLRMQTWWLAPRDPLAEWLAPRDPCYVSSSPSVGSANRTISESSPLLNPLG